MTEPNFLIVGAARSGTTTLCHYLARHGAVYLAKPLVPEPAFFVYPGEYRKGIRYHLKKYYSDVQNEQARGEKSTKYMTTAGTAGRIFRHFPKMRFIFLLRDPVERALSNYWWSVKNGLEDLPPAEAFSREEERIAAYKGKWRYIEPHSYLRRGFYIKFIQDYLKFFPKGNMLFLITEEMEKNPRQAVRQTSDFLGIAPMKKISPVRTNEALRLKPLGREIRRDLLTLYRKSNWELEEFLGRKITPWLR